MKNNNLLMAILLTCLGILIAACATDSSKRVSSPVVPDSIKVSDTEVMSFAASAKGFQIYECRGKKDDATQYEWVLKGPEADLFDARGKKIGRHYGGPTWESNDGSKTVGAVKASSPAPAPDAIPWLLLSATSTGPQGSFSKVTAIQRLNTVGGVAPASGCSQAVAGKPLRVNYTADYYFFAPK